MRNRSRRICIIRYSSLKSVVLSDVVLLHFLIFTIWVMFHVVLRVTREQKSGVKVSPKILNLCSFWKLFILSLVPLVRHSDPK